MLKGSKLRKLTTSNDIVARNGKDMVLLSSRGGLGIEYLLNKKRNSAPVGSSLRRGTIFNLKIRVDKNGKNTFF